MKGRAKLLVTGAVVVGIMATSATSAAAQEQEAGTTPMHELMMSGNPGMARMHELMMSGNPGMARMHGLMMGSDPMTLPAGTR